MAVQRTLAIIKPDAVAKKHIGHIVSRVEASGMRIVIMRMMRLTPEQARGFYHVHESRPFYEDLCAYMTSGPIVAMMLEGDNAIQRWREMIGPTDAAVAPPGTIRGDFGESLAINAVHGSDAPSTARYEIEFFFNKEPRHP
ncbi:MAG TPA: nucleoside-diphosphate kinase [Myxococcota bacterium]|nr:nucleoside-diphosphate kinase [Myxococcota bacterium]HPB50666.1 nucleoside-diphosphate kinase [Myxococcota bacterium]HQP95449.1 nucleoside-diphosphate kinase [Myxococcota bacterium]